MATETPFDSVDVVEAMGSTNMSVIGSRGAAAAVGGLAAAAGHIIKEQ
jgi:hypothetical protein